MVTLAMVTRGIGKRAGTTLGAGLALMVPAIPAQAKPAWVKSPWTSGTVVYADLCTLPRDGTRVGQRITLKRSPNGDGLTYEGAEVTAPLMAGSLTLDDATRTIAFVIETEAGPLHFAGRATSDALTGTFEDEAGAHPVHLPRVLRSHAHEACPEDSTGSLGGRREAVGFSGRPR